MSYVPLGRLRSPRAAMAFSGGERDGGSGGKNGVGTGRRRTAIG